MILQLLCCFGGAAGAEVFVGSTGESGVAGLEALNGFKSGSGTAFGCSHTLCCSRVGMLLGLRKKACFQGKDPLLLCAALELNPSGWLVVRENFCF